LHFELSPKQRVGKISNFASRIFSHFNLSRRSWRFCRNQYDFIWNW